MDFINRFLSFDKLIAPSLIKVIYFVGLALILLGVVLGVFGALASMGSDFTGGLGRLVLTPLGGAVGIIFWRFYMELIMVAFRISSDLRDMRNHQLGDTKED